MKRITALLHAYRLSDIVHALEAVGPRRLSITHAHGLLSASNQREQEFSVELGERMTQEIQLDVFCEDVDAASVSALRICSGLPSSVRSSLAAILSTQSAVCSSLVAAYLKASLM